MRTNKDGHETQGECAHCGSESKLSEFCGMITCGKCVHAMKRDARAMRWLSQDLHETRGGIIRDTDA